MSGGKYESKFSVAGFGHMPYQGGFLFGSVEAINDVTFPSKVPLPSAGFLFTPGLLLLSFAMRRNKKVI